MNRTNALATRRKNCAGGRVYARRLSTFVPRRVRYRARIRVSFRKRAFTCDPRRNDCRVGIKRFGLRRDATLCNAMRCNAFVERRDLRGLSTSNSPTSRSPSLQCSGDRVMDGTRWKISTMPYAYACAQVESNSFPIERSREGGPDVCLIRGNILMSRRITSYVCINLSCLGLLAKSRAHL